MQILIPKCATSPDSRDTLSSTNRNANNLSCTTSLQSRVWTYQYKGCLQDRFHVESIKVTFEGTQLEFLKKNLFSIARVLLTLIDNISLRESQNSPPLIEEIQILSSKCIIWLKTIGKRKRNSKSTTTRTTRVGQWLLKLTPHKRRRYCLWLSLLLVCSLSNS